MSADSLQEALLRAIPKGDLAAAWTLLDHGADVNATTSLKLSERGHLDRLAWIQVEMAAADGITPLRLAAWYGHAALARLLLDRGADINASAHRWETPVRIAAEQGYNELTRLLIDWGADLNNGWPDDRILEWYVGSGYTELVRALLDRGSDVNGKNDRGRTPLMLSAALSDERHSGFKERHLETVRLLFERGADPNARNHYGLTALMFAGRNTQVVRLLLEHGADVRWKDDGGRTALKWARIRGRAEAIELLWQAGATE